MTPFEEIAWLVKQRSGIALGADKVYLVETRLVAIVRRLGLSGYEAVASLLHSDDALQQEVVEALTTNETLFFRDRKQFDHLCAHALPKLHADRPAGMPLRIWSAGASTGQEAYSLAMQVSEMGAALHGRAIRILATDIARGPLARARSGTYSQFEIQRGIPARLLIKYFTKDADGWQVIRPIRDMVEFLEWNLLADPAPLGRFDIVFCRNVLLYFDDPTKLRVLSMIARCLAPGGLLYVGSAETIGGQSGNAEAANSFAAVLGEHCVYERRSHHDANAAMLAVRRNA